MARRKLPLHWVNNVHQFKINSARPIQRFNYFLILDFEATCEEGRQIEPQEIIEIPCLKVNSHNLQIESVFHEYVKPTRDLSSFCSKLTGITQEMVDNERPFEEVFQEFLKWQIREGLWQENVQSAFITYGDWDLRKMLVDQCHFSNLPVPPQMAQWINLKKIFAQFAGYFPRSLRTVCNALNLEMVGRLHSGIDDCQNIYRIVCDLVKKNVEFKITSTRGSGLP